MRGTGGFPRWLGVAFFLLGISLGGGAAWAMWHTSGGPAGPVGGENTFIAPPLTPAPAPVVGAPAPDFTLDTLDGTTLRLSDLAGTPVILNFWATWCDPCKEELPMLDQAAVGHSGRLRVLAVESGEPEGDLRTFLDAIPLPHLTVLMDVTGAIRDQYLVFGYPTTLFIDAAGTIRVRKVGTYDSSALSDSLRLLGVNP
jgi:cytochrome c biogenesis protein CcmG/thiol:disulfide interchange protein DsbE